MLIFPEAKSQAATKKIVSDLAMLSKAFDRPYWFLLISADAPHSDHRSMRTPAIGQETTVGDETTASGVFV
jgi:hypothetical protein